MRSRLPRPGDRSFTRRDKVLALFTGLLAASLGLIAPGQSRAEEVDLLLVLAVDISYSMDEDEQRLQRMGYIEAITSDEVLMAIREGLTGRIAVAYTEWAGATTQRVLVDWHIIADRDDAEQFAGALAEAPISRAYRTSIGEALYHAADLLEKAPHQAYRKVIDISGDGPNNQGRNAPGARDAAVEKGITINGLPLMLKRPVYGWFDIEDLDRYFADCVIGGPAAFSIPVRDTEIFPEAIRRKLVLEIAGRQSGPQQRREPGHEPGIWPDMPAENGDRDGRVTRAAQEYDPFCLIGEKLWMQRMLNGDR
ncbi:DUF1194 domain-containing protein [Stappia sp. F7233]|uniref:DUF1194 domain-containing protein n=2 Tax=Stappia albiluteola TaxID=2758565 RepID=A0A839ABD5_9HYPH|nr:DUF1194 domain-containing protein [Stappia albiluteola]